jgi:HEAT repeat protein
MGRLPAGSLKAAMSDRSPLVRRRACDVSVTVGRPPLAQLVKLLGDGDTSVVEAASYSLGSIASGAGERDGAAGERDGTVRALSSRLVTSALMALCRNAMSHEDAICREAAVAALGSIGDPRCLRAVLSALRDKPAVRRRAVIALAPFEGPDVDAALVGALDDPDWQVRQAAEDLLGRLGGT